MKGDRLFVKRQTELLEPLAEEKDRIITLKLACLQWFSSLGRALEAVGLDFAIATATGYLWLRPWNKAGYAGMSDTGQRPGRPPPLDEWELFFFTYRLPQQPPWTTAEVRDLIYRELRIASSPNQVSRLLRQRVGMHFNQPCPRDYRRPSDAEERRKSLHQACMRLNGKGIPKDDLALGFLEEASPQNRANTVRVWRLEKSPVLAKNTLHFKRNTSGFYASHGVSVQNFLINSKEEAVIDFLKRVSVAKVTVKAIGISLANDSSPRAANVNEAAQELDSYFV